MLHLSVQVFSLTWNASSRCFSVPLEEKKRHSTTSHAFPKVLNPKTGFTVCASLVKWKTYGLISLLLSLSSYITLNQGKSDDKIVFHQKVQQPVSRDGYAAELALFWVWPWQHDGKEMTETSSYIYWIISLALLTQIMRAFTQCHFPIKSFSALQWERLK